MNRFFRALAVAIVILIIAAALLILLPTNHARCNEGEKFVMGEDSWYCAKVHKPN